MDIYVQTQKTGSLLLREKVAREGGISLPLISRA